MNISYLMKFPDFIQLDITEPIDNFINTVNTSCAGFFTSLKSLLLGFVGGVSAIVSLIPWWIMLLLAFLMGFKMYGRIRRGLLYAAMLFLIGTFGLWELMNMTLSVVISSVLISLILGFPLGILISSSRRAAVVMKPLLDAMQTMPTFVYLIPAVMFFGLGTVPAVIATTIYAIPPMIRLTSHAIVHVSGETVEAAKAFGCTGMQALTKVQIPQAMPTIMTGVNQTMMMAVAMVVTSSMIGAKGLGMEVLIGINRLEIGRGFVSGLSIVFMAVLLDRLTQGCYREKDQFRKGAD